MGPAETENTAFYAIISQIFLFVACFEAVNRLYSGYNFRGGFDVGNDFIYGLV